MKISAIKTFLVYNGWDNCLFVKIETDEGISGVGEGTCGQKSKSIEAQVREFERHLIGKNPGLIEHHYQVLTRGLFMRGGIVSMSALSAIDQALWDIKGKDLGVPVHALLGGKVRDKVRVATHVDEREEGSIDEAIAEITRLKKMGWTAIKTVPLGHFKEPGLVKYGRVEEAKRRFKAIRDAVGDDFDILVDNHGRFSATEAITIGKALESFGPFWFEEPVPPEDLDGLAKVAASINIPVATGERALSRYEVKPILDRNAAAIIQSDVCHSGGISELRRINVLAETYGVKTAPHTAIGPVGTAASMHVNAASPNFLIQEIPIFEPGREHFPDWVSKLVKEPLIPENGYLKVHDKPGLGVELNEEIFSEHPYEKDERSIPHVFFEDGSLANW